MLRILNILKKKLFLITIFLITFLNKESDATDIIGPELKFLNNEIIITSTLSLDDKYIQEIKSGIKKEFIFYIDIYRVWNIWPDEFITGKKLIRTIKYDIIKNEFFASSNDGTTIIKKRFKSLESMLNWVLTIDGLKVAGLNELENGIYYVKVTVESKIRKLPPVIGYFMIFLPENEFKIQKNSVRFTTEQNK